MFQFKHVCLPRSNTQTSLLVIIATYACVFVPYAPNAKHFNRQRIFARRHTARTSNCTLATSLNTLSSPSIRHVCANASLLAFTFSLPNRQRSRWFMINCPELLDGLNVSWVFILIEYWTSESVGGFLYRMCMYTIVILSKNSTRMLCHVWLCVLKVSP